MKDVITQSLALLGLAGKDKVSGFEGTVTSISFDLYGCVCVALTPNLDKDGKLRDGHWFDVKRVVTGKKVMAPPVFAATVMGKEIGAAEKPPPVESRRAP